MIPCLLTFSNMCTLFVGKLFLVFKRWIWSKSCIYVFFISYRLSKYKALIFWRLKQLSYCNLSYRQHMFALLLNAESWSPISRDSGVKGRETCRPDSFRRVAIWLARNLLSFNMFYNQTLCYVNEVCFLEVLSDMKQT